MAAATVKLTAAAAAAHTEQVAFLSRFKDLTANCVRGLTPISEEHPDAFTQVVTAMEVNWADMFTDLGYDRVLLERVAGLHAVELVDQIAARLTNVR